MNIIIGFIYAIIAQILTYIQIQGNIKYDLLQKWPFITLLGAIPIAWLYIKSTEYFVVWYNGEIWPARFLGFATGIIVFGLMTILMFDEGLNLKTFICILLALSILLIQLLWK